VPITAAPGTLGFVKPTREIKRTLDVASNGSPGWDTLLTQNSVKL